MPPFGIFGNSFIIDIFISGTFNVHIALGIGYLDALLRESL